VAGLLACSVVGSTFPSYLGTVARCGSTIAE